MTSNKLVSEVITCDGCNQAGDIYFNSVRYPMLKLENFRGILSGDWHLICAENRLKMDTITESHRAVNEAIAGNCKYCDRELKNSDMPIKHNGNVFCNSVCEDNQSYLDSTGNRRDIELKNQAEARETDKKREELLNSLSIEQLQKLLEITK